MKKLLAEDFTDESAEDTIVETNLQVIQLQWRHTKSDGGLELWVNETGNWVKYNNKGKVKYYQADVALSSNSGFATFQNYLKLSKQGLFKLDILQTEQKD